MPPRRGPDGSARIAISGAHHGEAWANVFWCNLTGGSAAGQTDFNNWVIDFSTQYTTAFGPWISNTVSLTQAKGTLFQPGNTVLQSVHPLTSTGGDASGEVQDLAASAVVSWVTNQYYRGGKPRTYLPGLTTARIINASDLSPAAITALQGNGNAFHNAVNAIVDGAITGTSHGFVSFSRGNVPINPGVFYPVTGAVVHSRIGTVRRRLGKWTP